MSSCWEPMVVCSGGSGLTPSYLCGSLSLLRIVAARLNGSLDFFTVEINKPPCLLQYRGQRNPQESLMLLDKPGQVRGKLRALLVQVVPGGAALRCPRVTAART